MIAITPQQRRVYDALLNLTDHGSRPWSGPLAIPGMSTEARRAAVRALCIKGVLSARPIGPNTREGSRFEILAKPERLENCAPRSCAVRSTPEPVAEFDPPLRVPPEWEQAWRQKMRGACFEDDPAAGKWEPKFYPVRADARVL